MLIAGIVMTVALIPIIGNFQTLFRQYKKTHQTTHALNIAQCILESIRYRLYDGDARFFKLNDSLPDRLRALNDRPKKYEEFFLKLAEGGPNAPGAPGVRITEVTPKDCSKYFQDFMKLPGTGPQGIRDGSNPVLSRQLDTYRAKVTIFLDIPKLRMDSDGNEKPEIDMCELAVEVSWKDTAGKDQSQTLFTALTRRQYNQFPDGAP